MEGYARVPLRDCWNAYAEYFNTVLNVSGVELQKECTLTTWVLALSTDFFSMAEVRDILAASQFQFDPSWANIISGEEEGAYGWVSINLQLGLLTNNGIVGVTFGELRQADPTARIFFRHQRACPFITQELWILAALQLRYQY